MRRATRPSAAALLPGSRPPIRQNPPDFSQSDGEMALAIKVNRPVHNTKHYETGLVVLLFLTWGTVFLDRMSVVYLAPFLAPELHLSHAQVGLLVSALALAWALSGLVFGAVSDRVGRRPVFIPAVFLFSALSWLSAIARGFTQLFLIRTLMGAAEGPTWSTITATIEESSAPERRGRNVGIVISAAALVGLAPFNRDSGAMRGKRTIAGGRKRVRDALYIAALTASRSSPHFSAIYNALVKAGKAKKLALIAVARRLLVAINAMIRDGVDFKPA